MKTAETLCVSHAGSVEITLNGTDLVLEASSPPSKAVLDALSRNRTKNFSLVHPGGSVEDWQVFFDKRAGIDGLDDGLLRSQARAQVFSICNFQHLNSKPVNSTEGRCVGCGRSNQAHDSLLLFGTETSGHPWLHKVVGGSDTKAGNQRPSPHLLK